MKYKFVLCVAPLLSIFSGVVIADAGVNLKLEKIIEVYELKACKPPPKKAGYEFGKFLFNSKLLSGDRDVSCATCHLTEKGLADGLPLAVGVGGEGESLSRLYEGKGTLVQRNAFSLFGRGHLVNTNFFWDGKVDSADDGRIFSPLGNQISKKFSSALAVAAVLPLTERDEFLGKSNFFSANELIKAAGDKYYGERYTALGRPLQERLKNEAKAELSNTSAWRVIDSPDFELADIGNGLASFIKTEFACRKSAWEAFLAGNKNALNAKQKEGAILFYGKARCATCHSGAAFTDFRFHSIGVPQGEFGPSTRRRDLGRAQVTNKREDMYRFRTPPLLAVGETSPYGHNGIFKSLEEVVLHHVNPMLIYLDDSSLSKPQNRLKVSKTLDSRDPKLQLIEIENEEELQRLVDFLKAL